MLIIILIFIIVPLTKADFFDWLRKTITGKASSQPTNVSVSITGANQIVVESVSIGSSYQPVEISTRLITAYVVLYDADGVNDINDSATQIYFNRTSQTTRSNLTCLNLTDIDGNRANFSCIVDMWYWDLNGTWSVNATGNDLGNKTRAYNLSQSFNYGQLPAMVISPNALTWPSLNPGATNQTSDNDPTTINNTGNYNGTIRITALNLLGQSISSEQIYAENFTADIDTGVGPPPAECTSATQLQNNTAVTITGAVPNPGNLSAGGGVGQEQIYYCITRLASTLSSQTYSTTGLGSWTIAYA